MANNVVFSISTQLEMEGRQLKAVKPDQNGVYKGIPLTVIGCNSRNQVNYEKESVLQCLTSMESRFAANVSTGDMEGEWGHPLLQGDKCLDRLLYIDRTRVSHFFTKVYGKDVGNGLIMIYGDVKPYGPYGKYLKDSLEDPVRNASFSLRSAAVVTGKKDGIVQKRMLSLVTFDAVDGPGFLKASKRFQDPDVATESLHGFKVSPTLDKEGSLEAMDLEIEATKEEFLKTQEAMKLAGQEGFEVTNQAILDAFECNRIVVRDKVLSRDIKGRLILNGRPVSLFDQCFRS